MSVLSGMAVSSTQHYIPFMFAGAAVSTVGAGLVYSFSLHTPTGAWIGYQFVVGIGTGFVSQIPIMANMAAVEMSDMASMSAITLFFQLLGGSFAVSAAQSAFENTLLRRVAETTPGVSPTALIAAGVTQLRTSFSADQVPGVLSAYMDGLKAAYALALALVAISTVFALTPKWERLRPKPESEEAVEEKPVSGEA